MDKKKDSKKQVKMANDSFIKSRLEKLDSLLIQSDDELNLYIEDIRKGELGKTINLKAKILAKTVNKLKWTPMNVAKVACFTILTVCIWQIAINTTGLYEIDKTDKQGQDKKVSQQVIRMDIQNDRNGLLAQFETKFREFSSNMLKFEKRKDDKR